MSAARLAVLFVCMAALALPASATHEPWTTQRFPQDQDKWWWDADWWERGAMPVPANYGVRSRSETYRSGEVEVPVEIFTPAAAGRFPVVVFLHGRRGLDELTRLVPRRLAARGFTVVAPDLYTGRGRASPPATSPTTPTGSTRKRPRRCRSTSTPP